MVEEAKRENSQGAAVTSTNLLLPDEQVLVTNAQLTEWRDKVDARLSDMEARVIINAHEARFAGIEARMDSVDTRGGKVAADAWRYLERLNAVKKHVATLEAKIDHLTTLLAQVTANHDNSSAQAGGGRLRRIRAGR